MKTIKRIVAITLVLALIPCSMPVSASKLTYNDDFEIHYKTLNDWTDTYDNALLLKYNTWTTIIGGKHGGKWPHTFVHKKINKKEKLQYKGFKALKKDLNWTGKTKKYYHCDLKSVYLKGYKHNRNLKAGEWIERKYLENGTLVIRYKKRQWKKPKIKVSLSSNGSYVSFDYKILNANQSIVSKITIDVIPCYFKNTTGCGSKKVVYDGHTVAWRGYDGCTKKTEDGQVVLKGGYKSIHSFTYKMKIEYYDVKLTKGVPKIIKRKKCYNRNFILHKTLSKKMKKEKLKKH